MKIIIKIKQKKSGIDQGSTIVRQYQTRKYWNDRKEIFHRDKEGDACGKFIFIFI